MDDLGGDTPMTQVKPSYDFRHVFVVAGLPSGPLGSAVECGKPVGSTLVGNQGRLMGISSW